MIGVLSAMETSAGAGLAWGWSGTVVHIAISDKQRDLPHRLQLEGEKINFPSHDHRIHTRVCPHSYSLAPESCPFAGAPNTVIKQRRLEKGRQSTGERVSFSVNARFSASVRLQLWHASGCFLGRVFLMHHGKKILMTSGGEANRLNYYKILGVDDFS